MEKLDLHKEVDMQNDNQFGIILHAHILWLSNITSYYKPINKDDQYNTVFNTESWKHQGAMKG